MSGPEHYREAERLLEQAGDYTADDAIGVALAQRAQVHATLALVAISVADTTFFSEKTAMPWVEAVRS